MTTIYKHMKTANQKYLEEKNNSLGNKGFKLDRKMFYFWSFFTISILILGIFVYQINDKIEKTKKIKENYSILLSSINDYINDDLDIKDIDNHFFTVTTNKEKEQFTVEYYSYSQLECLIFYELKNWEEIKVVTYDNQSKVFEKNNPNDLSNTVCSVNNKNLYFTYNIIKENKSIE